VQRLFEGLLSLEEQGVERVFVHEVAEEWESLAFYEPNQKCGGDKGTVRIYHFQRQACSGRRLRRGGGATTTKYFDTGAEGGSSER
jgi:hypothetical protein